MWVFFSNWTPTNSTSFGILLLFYNGKEDIFETEQKQQREVLKQKIKWEGKKVQILIICI